MNEGRTGGAERPQSEFAQDRAASLRAMFPGGGPPLAPPEVAEEQLEPLPPGAPDERRKRLVIAIVGLVAVIAAIGAVVLYQSAGESAADKIARSPVAVPTPLAFSLHPESPTVSKGKTSAASPPVAGIATPTPGSTVARRNPSGGNLALHKAAAASSEESSGFPASAAVDGTPDTRWSSEFADPQWIAVDLGATYQVTRVRLVWERAYATRYEVDLSLDGTRWSSVFATNSGTGGTVDVDAGSYPARYVRMLGTGRSGTFGYSLLEFEVH